MAVREDLSPSWGEMVARVSFEAPGVGWEPLRQLARMAYQLLY